MKTRQLGDLTVSEVGMGCMAFSHGYGKIPPEQYSIEAIQNAYRHGCTLFDTAEIYSPNLAGIGHNERIVGKALKDVRKDVVLATKLFLDRSEARGKGGVYRAIRSHLEDSMDRLRTDMVDLYYLHRTNGGVMIEDVAEAMGLLIKPDKEKSTEKIDGAVATIMGLDRAIRNAGSTGSVYDERGILSI